MSLAQIGNRRPAGFTLLELMLVVAIIGLLAAVAIPNFLHYQATTRRSEAFANVQAIANMETTYFGEHDMYFERLLAMPEWTNPAVKPSGNLDTTKMDWDAASAAAFAGLGWAPESRVFYSYEVLTDCNGIPSFTATAYGNVDDDDFYGAIQYGKPDSDGFLCAPALLIIGSPTHAEEVMVNLGADAH